MYLKEITFENVSFEDKFADFIAYLKKNQTQIKALSFIAIKNIMYEDLNALIDAVKRISTLEELRLTHIPEIGFTELPSPTIHKLLGPFQNQWPLYTIKQGFIDHKHLKVLDLSND